MNEQELRQMFKNQSDCYTVFTNYLKGTFEEQAMTENRFVEVVEKILNAQSESKIVSKNEKQKEVCPYCKEMKVIVEDGMCSECFSDYHGM